jgi:glutamate dehydrogenase (NAD(P)+)
VIDRLIGGLAGGGIRMRDGVTLEEVSRLARAMSHKKGLMKTLGGGAKGGIDCDPRDQAAPGLLARYVSALSPLFRHCWSTAEDLGVSQQLLDEIFAHQGLGFTIQASIQRSNDPISGAERVRKARTILLDGLTLPECIGGYGVAEATAAAAEHIGVDIRDARVVIQGFGTMGGAAARYLSRLGARVVAVADVEGLIANPAGLDVEALLRSRWRGELDRSHLDPGARLMSGDAWLEVECDVLVPASVPDAITADNADAVRASLVVEAANLPTTEGARRRLAARGVVVVPDFVANAATTAWWTWTATGVIGADAREATSRVKQTMHEAVAAVLDLARARGCTPYEAAIEIAEWNLDDMEARFGGG